MADALSTPTPLSPDELQKINAYWRACNYLSAGMIYLRDNPLLRQPLKPEHTKNRLLGHWGSDPGQSLIWGSLEPPDPQIRFGRHLHLRSRSRRARHAFQLLSRRPLLGDLSREEPRRSRHAQVLSPVFISRRNRLALHTGNARLDPRRRRTRIFHLARVWRSLRQSKSDRHSSDSATVKPKPARSQLPGIPINF